MGYRFSEKASQDAYAIYEASLEQFGERAADKYFEIMLEATKFAGEYPLASPERAETTPPLRVRYFGAHLIVYEVLDRDVVIQRIFHQSQDWLDLL